MMCVKRVLIGAALLAAVGCAGVAETTRTGAIHEVNFEERMTPTELSVQVGDEIRWVNRRSTPVTLEFLEGALDNVVCQRGFSTFIGRRQESISVRPNDSASLCFGDAGTVTYNARMDSPVGGGQTIESGTVHIEQ